MVIFHGYVSHNQRVILNIVLYGNTKTIHGIINGCEIHMEIWFIHGIHVSLKFTIWASDGCANIDYLSNYMFFFTIH